MFFLQEIETLKDLLKSEKETIRHWEVKLLAVYVCIVQIEFTKSKIKCGDKLIALLRSILFKIGWLGIVIYTTVKIYRSKKMSESIIKNLINLHSESTSISPETRENILAAYNNQLPFFKHNIILIIFSLVAFVVLIAADVILFGHYCIP